MIQKREKLHNIKYKSACVNALNCPTCMRYVKKMLASVVKHCLILLISVL